SMSRINDAVKRILRVKFRAGLFDHPYTATESQVPPPTADARAAERNAASRSMVLLKNDGGTLPLNPSKSVAVIGPLGDDQHDIKAIGKPFVVVLFNGRPVTLSAVDASSPAILEAWFPGTEAGNAVADVLFGKVNPGGKLPVTFPRSVGQVPIYYNHEPTGRPCDPTSKYNSRYRDIPSCAPLYPFGFGLSYTTFDLSN